MICSRRYYATNETEITRETGPGIPSYSVMQKNTETSDDTRQHEATRRMFSLVVAHRVVVRSLSSPVGETKWVCSDVTTLRGTAFYAFYQRLTSSHRPSSFFRSVYAIDLARVGNLYP
jgi:hypothetical protein